MLMLAVFSTHTRFLNYGFKTATWLGALSPPRGALTNPFFDISLKTPLVFLSVSTFRGATGLLHQAQHILNPSGLAGDRGRLQGAPWDVGDLLQVGRVVAIPGWVSSPLSQFVPQSSCQLRWAWCFPSFLPWWPGLGSETWGFCEDPLCFSVP